jgi:hypothetical protein
VLFQNAGLPEKKAHRSICLYKYNVNISTLETCFLRLKFNSEVEQSAAKSFMFTRTIDAKKAPTAHAHHCTAANWPKTGMRFREGSLVKEF